MPKPSGGSKCAECTRRGRLCIKSSWAAIDAARNKLSEEIVENEKKKEQLIAELAEIQARIDRKRKTREQAEQRAKEKMKCLI